MASAQRSFTQKLNKLQNADMRRQVMTGAVGGRMPSTPTIEFPANSLAAPSSGYVSAPVDVVEPVDFEESVAQKRGGSFDSTSSNSGAVVSRRWIDFPPDDVDVRRTRREPTTLDPPFEAGKEDQVDPLARDFLATYSKDLCLVERKYHYYSTGEAYQRRCDERPIFAQSLPQQIYESADNNQRDSGGSAGAQTSASTSQRASYASLGSSDSAQSEAASLSTARADLDACQADAPIPGVTGRLSLAQVDSSNESRRLSGRHANVAHLMALRHPDEIIEMRSPPMPPEEHFRHRILLRILDFSLESQFEPVFVSTALYDVKERKKVSETFYFDANTDVLNQMLVQHSPRRDASTRCRSAVFNITHASPDLFFIFRIEKVLQPGEIAEAAEPYTKDEKNRDKLRHQALENCARLGAYRMPLAWTAVEVARVVDVPAPDGGSGGGGGRAASTPTPTPSSATLPSHCSDTESIVSADRQSLMSSDTFRRVGSASSFCRKEPVVAKGGGGGDLSSFTPVTITANSFFRQDSERLSDDDLIKYLIEAKKPSSSLSKRLKVIPATLRVEISPCPDELENRLSPELHRMAPFSKAEIPPAHLVKELTEFPLHDVYATNFDYRNLVYVYPRAVNFSSRSGSARNITVRVQLMESERHAMQLLFGKSSCSELVSTVYTTVSYHNRAPQFYDEIKAKLPLNLADNHHLLFTFCHISCKAKGVDASEVETPIGYSWLPLYRDGRLQCGDFELPISLESLPSGYPFISPEVNLPHVKWLDGHRGAFRVSVAPSTTVHTGDDHLNAFVRLLRTARGGGRAVAESELLAVVRNLTKARPEPLVRYLYVLLDKLLALCVDPPASAVGQPYNLSPTCFEMLGQLVKILTYLLDGSSDRHGRSALLATYIHYHRVSVAGSASSTSTGTLTKSGSGASLQQKPPSPDQKDLLHIIEGYEKASSRHNSPLELGFGLVKPIHEELALQWVVSSGAAREMAYANAWFFLELMVKSMAEYLSDSSRLYLPRKLRFPSHFVDDVSTLVTYLTSEVVCRCSKDQSRQLNRSLAFFIRDALSLMDRTYVLGLVRHYSKQLTAKIASLPEHSAKLMHLKLDFVQIVCSHEHFLILNLPFSVVAPSPIGSTRPSAAGGGSQLQPPSPSPSLSSRSSAGAASSTGSHGSSLGAADLSADFRARHFLVGLVLADLAAALQSADAALQQRAVGLLHNLLAAHDADARFADPLVRSRVAALYLPLVGLALDCRARLHNPAAGATQSARAHVVASAPADLTDAANVDPKVALAIAGMAASPPSSPVRAEPPVAAAAADAMPRLSPSTTRSLLGAFCWVLKNLDRHNLRSWLRDLSEADCELLLDVLHLTASVFEYRAAVDPLREAILGPNRSAAEFLRRRKSQLVDGSATVRWRKEHYRHSSLAGDGVVKPASVAMTTAAEADAAPDPIETNLAAEMNLVVLDTVEAVLKVMSGSGAEHLSHLLPSVLRVLTHMLSLSQSVVVFENVFATQRAFAFRYPELVFDQQPEQCAELCYQLLRRCGGGVGAIRSQATASLYLLMRQSYEGGLNFARLKMQVTVALSQLVSSSAAVPCFNDDGLRRSLKTVLNYLEQEASPQAAPGSFPHQVRDLVRNLNGVLSDTIQMHQLCNDFEMQVDLMYRIAKGYQNSPDLRLTWLLSLAAKHTERENHAEAAQCVLHAAALVAEYLDIIETRDHLPRGAAAFTRLSENILEESAVSDDVVSPEEEGICECRHFSEAGLLQLLEWSARLFGQAQMFEAMAATYKLVFTVLEEWRDYRRISQLHARLSESLAKIDADSLPNRPPHAELQHPLQTADRRVFGTYFRVGFYGALFGDLHASEFVYKEPAITKLSEISHRLLSFYADRFGSGSVEVIKDSSPVDVAALPADKAFLQITYVEPAFELWEMRRRPTHFERNYNLRRFAFATPFTLDGRAHGDLRSQHKRRTVLTTAHSFPYVKTRLLVVGRQETVLTPIEAAIEDVQKKSRELAHATAQEPPDAKMLQMVLQGCIGTTVNQGPMEIANVFLTEASADANGRPQMDRLQNRLRLCFKDFSKRCCDALRKNRRLIQADQSAYQAELERNYIEFSRRLAPLINTASMTAMAQSVSTTRHSRLDAALDGPVSAV